MVDAIDTAAVRALEGLGVEVLVARPAPAIQGFGPPA
jgi:hypothetical protein